MAKEKNKMLINILKNKFNIEKFISILNLSIFRINYDSKCGGSIKCYSAKDIIKISIEPLECRRIDIIISLYGEDIYYSDSSKSEIRLLIHYIVSRYEFRGGDFSSDSGYTEAEASLSEEEQKTLIESFFE